jgi:hypothetical protein
VYNNTIYTPTDKVTVDISCQKQNIPLAKFQASGNEPGASLPGTIMAMLIQLHTGTQQITQYPDNTQFVASIYTLLGEWA